MNTLEIKESLHQQIELLDEKFLRAVHAMVVAYVQPDHIVGATVAGQPLTIKDLEQKIEKGEQQLENGEYYSIQELENISQKWFNTKS